MVAGLQVLEDELEKRLHLSMALLQFVVEEVVYGFLHRVALAGIGWVRLGAFIFVG